MSWDPPEPDRYWPVCPNCDGRGWVYEHTAPVNHPEQLGCMTCNATGRAEEEALWKAARELEE